MTFMDLDLFFTLLTNLRVGPKLNVTFLDLKHKEEERDFVPFCRLDVTLRLLLLLPVQVTLCKDRGLKGMRIRFVLAHRMT